MGARSLRAQTGRFSPRPAANPEFYVAHFVGGRRIRRASGLADGQPYREVAIVDRVVWHGQGIVPASCPVRTPKGAGFYAVAALFGFIYAGVMPLYAVLARENFPLKMMGTVIGGTAMAGSLSMATGPIAGGLIYDIFASYAWLYIGAWGMGLGAVLMALSFRPFPKARVAAVPA
jgi:MFS family permease